MSYISKKNVANYSTCESTHNHNTRHKANLTIPYFRITKTQNSYYYWGVKMFNKLPASIRKADISYFKKTLQDYLMGQAFYSIEEFLTADMGLL